ncbi:ABC transporter substrate-binding protein [Microbacterium sp. A204]|uniref:ABC transporter substrate-binding protein n=1 Tax=Microbacterium sp. A204 TaxID=3457321 RepID=UPI003FD37FD3
MSRMHPVLKIGAPLVVAGLLLAGCSGTGGDETGPSAEEGTNDTLKANWGSFPENWAPGVSNEPGYMRVPYQTLVNRSTTGEILPNLATAWEFNDDATVLTVTLREDVTFHDGTAFNADAVAANFDYIANTVGGEYGGPLKVQVASVDAVDEYTAAFNLTQPNPEFVATLSQMNMPIGSPAAIADGSIETHPVGTSPWQFDADGFIAGTKASFVQYEDYWGDQPAFENIELYGVTDVNSVAAGILSGEFDVADSEPEVISMFESSANADFYDYPAIRNNITFFDRAEGGQFADPRVRQALCMAMDNEAVAALGDGTAQPQHFIDGEPAHNPAIAGYDGQLDEALALWEELGNPTIEAEMSVAPFTKNESAQRAEQMGQLPNVTITVQEFAPPQWSGNWNSGQFGLGLGQHSQIVPSAWYSTWWAAGAGANPAGEESAELKSLADAALAASEDEAPAAWQAVMQQIADEALVCSHNQGNEMIAFNTSTVDNVQPFLYWEPKQIDYYAITPAA